MEEDAGERKVCDSVSLHLLVLSWKRRGRHCWSHGRKGEVCLRGARGVAAGLVILLSVKLTGLVILLSVKLRE